MSRLLLALLACAVLAFAGCGGDDKESSATPTATAEAGATATPEDTGGEQGTGCKPVAKPRVKRAKLAKPKAALERSKTYVATVATNCGDFEITLDAKRAPRTGGSFKRLADKGFYDGLGFHRIVPGFVIQGGDPTQSGNGGPGYTTVDPPAAGAAYTKGVVAMAKTAAEPAGTAGSQFFVVTGADAGLPPEYAVVGTVTSGLDVVERIGELGDPSTEQPLQPVVIHSVTVGPET